MKRLFGFTLFMLIFIMACAKQQPDVNSESKAGLNNGKKGLLGDLATLVAGKWKTVYIPGAYCSDGSQFKIFIQKADSLSDIFLGNNKRLSIYLQGGGACWDYASCTGQAGVRSAVNLNGIPDNYMDLGAYLEGKGGSMQSVYSPLILPNHPSGRNIKVSKWNKVFIPYCTGDVHSGNTIATYTDPSGQKPPLVYRHFGHINMEKVIEYLKNNFYKPEEMFVTGYSAGGAGSLINYHFFRKALNPKKSYLLNDAGPIFTAPNENYYQYRLQQYIRQTWNIDYLLKKLKQDIPQFDLFKDFGLINDALATTYPQDKLAISVMVRDGVYSGYSYARFYNLDESNSQQKEQIYSMWKVDLQNMMKQYDKYSNLKYFIPYYRNIFEGHCATVVEFHGTEIYSSRFDAGNFIDSMLSGFLFKNYYEEYNPSDKNVNDFWMELVNIFHL